MARVIDLDQIMLSPRVVKAWLAKARESRDELEGIDPKIIPDEQGRVNDDGTLTIFLELPGGKVVSMDVPRGDWSYRH